MLGCAAIAANPTYGPRGGADMMQVLHGLEFVPVYSKGAVLAIGNFDGVHRGHQALIERTAELARKTGRHAGVMIFEPHPREYFHPNDPHFRLTQLPEKLRLFEAQGLKLAIVMSFDHALAGLDAEEFIARYLVEALLVSHVVIGYDFFFGKGRGGTPESMRTAGLKFGFGVTVVDPVAEDGEVFSSTAIRLKLAQGDVTGATHDLGRPWRVAGKVVAGARRGAVLGFPTANLPMPKGTALAHGIYAVRVEIGAERYQGAAYLGTRPTFDDGMPVLEVFLFDFEGDLYGRDMSVEFIGFVRPDRKFWSAEALRSQMVQDCEEAKRMLGAHSS
jgi:riboflavin kinase/FMN adenylyltransferase